MTTNSLTEVIDACRKADSILITSHTGPDGDSIGCVLSMRSFLGALGKKNITCASQDPVPRIYQWMPGVPNIVNVDGVSGPYDLVVVLDVAQRDRLGQIGEKLPEDQKFVIIDHHPEEHPFGAVNFVDRTYSSCTEIVLDLYDAAGLTPSLDAATAIYVGLVTDTGSFRFGNTDPRAHRNAARLLGLGVDAVDIAARVFDVMSMQKVELLRRVLERVQRSDCGRFAWSYLIELDLQQADADSDDTEGLINFVRNIEGVSVAAFFRELQPGRVKVSVRARDHVDAGLMLKPLGGGGHKGAAGVILHAPLKEAIERVTERIADALGPAPAAAKKKSR
jgi:bifunctional oligoribonuclease and PAP phosphatase NrnA